MNRFSNLLFIGILFLAAACSPDLGMKISVPPVPDPQRSAPVGSSGEPIRLRVGNFLDGRTDTTLAVIDGRKIASDGSLGAVVQEGLERYFKTAGASVVLFQAPIVEGEIVEWRADVRPAFPLSEATAVARVKVSLRGEGSKVFYRASYSGEATTKHPLMTEQGVRELLAEAMGSALEEVANDRDLVAQLSRARNY